VEEFFFKYKAFAFFLSHHSEFFFETILDELMAQARGNRGKRCDTALANIYAYLNW